MRGIPDEARLSSGVVTQGATAADALGANARAMNEVFATLKRIGIPEKSIQTSEFSVTPQYSNERNGNAQRIVGYQVTNNVSVTVDDLAKLGPALDALVASGSNSLGGVSFSIHDPKPLLAQARAAAMKDAMARAKTYAGAAGLQLGPILSIAEGGAEVPRPLFVKAMDAMAPASTPVAAGEESVSASVSVTFEIR